MSEKITVNIKNLEGKTVINKKNFPFIKFFHLMNFFPSKIDLIFLRSGEILPWSKGH